MKPSSGLFDVEEIPDENKFRVSLSNPPEFKEAQRHSEEVERLMERFYPSAGDAEALGNADRLVPNLDGLKINNGSSEGALLDPKNLDDGEIRYLVGMRAKYFWRTSLQF